MKIIVGSKNFTEQKILGEIFAQGLAAAGYDVKTELNLGDEKTALKALESGDDRRLPGVHRHGARLVLRRRVGGHPDRSAGRPSRRPRTGFAKKGLTALPPTPFTSSNEVGADRRQGRGARRREDLRPRRASPQDLTLYGSPGVPPAPGLPARAAAGLRPEVQEVRAGRHRAAPRGAREGPGRPVDRLHDRPAERARRPRAARGRQGHVPALQLDAGRPRPDDRGGRAGPRRRSSTRSRRA